MATISSFLSELARWGHRLLDVAVPPICVHCGGRRFGGLPLCRSCLRILRAHRSAEAEQFRPPALNQGLSVLYRAHPPLLSLVHGFKYRHLRRHIHFLCAALRRRPGLRETLRAAEAVVPVPLHRAKLRERGYNQAGWIAREIGRQCGISLRPEALTRRLSTRPQAKLGEADRAFNLEGVFRADGEVRGRKILLVDDVCTTGNTLGACREALLRAGALQVECFALAFVERRHPAPAESLETLAGFLA